MLKLMQSLVNTWGEAVLELMIDKSVRSLNGGILCPSCSRVHGRSIDAGYGFLYLFQGTEDLRFRNAAFSLFDWTSQLISPDGSFGNDLHIAEWKGITVFNLITLLTSIQDFQDSFSHSEITKWRSVGRDAANYVRDHFEIHTGNINYPISAAYALHLAAEVYGDASYAAKGTALVHECMRYFTEDGLIYGEGRPQDSVTDSGCRPIDVGYNVEETLPNLALYALKAEDHIVMEKVLASLRRHLIFALPDGGWDNSWGSRMYKWSYWGSRTCDGAALGLVAMSHLDKRFIPVALRNISLLQRCSSSGLLSGGVGYVSSGELPCVHHTICHFKSLATVLTRYRDVLLAYEEEHAPVDPPIELSDSVSSKGYSVTKLPATNIVIYEDVNWRCTLTNYDWVYAPGCTPSGGTLSLLYAHSFGPVIAAGMNRNVVPEAVNMQTYIGRDFKCVTPRVEYDTAEGHLLQSNDCLSAKVTMEANDLDFSYAASGILGTPESDAVDYGELPYRFIYRFKDGKIRIGVEACEESLFVLPLIVFPEGEITISENRLSIRRGKKTLLVSIEGAAIGRIDDVFNYQPGFLTKSLSIPVNNGISVDLSLAGSSAASG